MEYPIWGVIALIFSIVSIMLNIKLTNLYLEHSDRLENLEDFVAGKTRFLKAQVEREAMNYWDRDEARKRAAGE